MILLFALTAFAGEQEVEDTYTCQTDLAVTPEKLSVAWVSPVRRRTRGGAWIPVVRTAELQQFIRTEQAGVGRTLQHLGLRFPSKDPRRAWKVTIFEVQSEDLCRPLAGVEPGSKVSGLEACPHPHDRETRTYNGCGYTTDFADDSRGLDLYRIRWRDAARNGFCVVTAERFAREAQKR